MLYWQFRLRFAPHFSRLPTCGSSHEKQPPRARPSCSRVVNWIVVASTVAVGLFPPAAAADERPTAIKHPVLKHESDSKKAASEESLKQVMAMSEDDMLKLIPTRTGVVFCGCPNCKGGQQESGQFRWSIDRPFTLRCRFCDHEYPSEKYPANADG